MMLLMLSSVGGMLAQAGWGGQNEALPIAGPGPGGGFAGAGRSQTARRHGGSCYLPPPDKEPGTDTRCLFVNWHREVREHRGEGGKKKNIIGVISVVISAVGNRGLGKGEPGKQLLGDGMWPPGARAGGGVVLLGDWGAGGRLGRGLHKGGETLLGVIWIRIGGLGCGGWKIGVREGTGERGAWLAGDLCPLGVEMLEGRPGRHPGCG